MGIYDIVVIGMGPAGMAVSAMAVKMGLSVLGIEKHKVGGECLNCGCIPSKALLKAGEMRTVVDHLARYGISSTDKPPVDDPLAIVRDKVDTISGPKTMKAFENVDLVLGKGSARFVGPRTVEVDGTRYTGKRVFIATGTAPSVPPIPGIDTVDVLTNVNLFEQREIPESLMIIGGGAIGTEMAQAFRRLGSQVVLAHMDRHLVPAGDEEAGRVLQKSLEEEGVQIFNEAGISEVRQEGEKIVTVTSAGTFTTEKLLVAAGRKPVLDELDLKKGGVKYTPKGIVVNGQLQTSARHVYAVGDCNGISMFSHAAMHQGMLALMNAVNPTPFGRKKHTGYPIPWTVFTKPEVGQVGMTEKEAAEAGITYKVVVSRYADYGRAVADGQPEGFVKVITDRKGRIYGATVVGESASELIHEWTMAIQFGHSLYDIMMMHHSFPTLSLMNKRVAENWMMEHMETPWLRRLIRAVV
jgi:pyruvate/2-oxoglutarate dehydrogenase complex dihydrolipoamide dehydrogenase (E3) component